MSAKVAFLSQEVKADENAPRIAVPASAIVEREGRKVMYVVKDGKAAEVAAQAGPAIGDLVPVQGIEPGDKVVLKPSERVRDGVEVATAGK
jgi:hypothetical protein